MKIDLNIPDSKSGDYVIHNFEVTEDRAASIKKYTNKYEPGREIPAGKYVRLMRKSEDGQTVCVMSNTPAEIKDHEAFINMASGDILINGLGLGMCVQTLLKKESVRSITVIEKSWDVINLVRLTITDKRVRVIKADAFEYQPDEIYDFVWHDIWDDIFAGNLPQMQALFDKYKNFSAWQGAWAIGLCVKDYMEMTQASLEVVLGIESMYRNQVDARIKKSKKGLVAA